MALPPIKGQGIGSLIVPKEDLEADYCWATNRPNTGANIQRELLAPQGGENPDVNKLESYTPSVRGSREKPSIMRYPFDIGNAKSEMPHVMQFKIYWRWENPEFAAQASKLKAEAEQNLETLVNTTSLIEDGNYNIDALIGNPNFGLDYSAQDFGNATLMLSDPSFVDPKNPSNDRNLANLLSNPETREEGRRIMERNVRSATDRVEAISSDYKTGDKNFGSTDITKDPTVLSGRFNRLTKEVTKAGEIDSLLSSFGFNQRDPQYDQMVSIYLPICTRINNEETFSYTDADMKLASGIVAGLGTAVNGVRQGQLGVSMLELAKQAGLAYAANVLANSPAGSALTSLTGLVLNPRIEKLFQQKDIRNFNFSWDLYPRNEEEVKMIQSIIETFRYHSHPARSMSGDAKLDPQIMLRVPAEFTIKFLSSAKGNNGGGFVENEYIPKISRCVLTNINVDYAPNGVFSTLEDNSPTGYTLTLSFSEIAQLTREDVEAGF